MSFVVRQPTFKEKVFLRQLRVQIDGNAKIEYGLSDLRGVGRRFAQAVIRVAGISPDARIGALSEKELNRVEEIILNPAANGIPLWMLNRRKDTQGGKDIQVVGNQLELAIKRDIDRMKRIKSYKGIRHSLGLKVRGQRTKSTGRHGLVIGVQRKKKGQAAPGQEVAK